jgi:hypothetical protein
VNDYTVRVGNDQQYSELGECMLKKKTYGWQQATVR